MFIIIHLKYLFIKYLIKYKFNLKFKNDFKKNFNKKKISKIYKIQNKKLN